MYWLRSGEVNLCIYQKLFEKMISILFTNSCKSTALRLLSHSTKVCHLQPTCHLYWMPSGDQMAPCWLTWHAPIPNGLISLACKTCWSSFKVPMLTSLHPGMKLNSVYQPGTIQSSMLMVLHN